MSPLTLALVSATCVAVGAQLPPPEKLSAEDNRAFTAELNQVRDLLGRASDKCSVEFQIARTYAAGGQYREALEWLKKVTDADSGFDPSRDKLFTKLSSAEEYRLLLAKVHSQTPSVSNSHFVTTIREPSLVPENLAYDTFTKTFLLGSMGIGEIVRCDDRGRCRVFAAPHRDGLGEVLGLKVDRGSRTLWATSNTREGASLRHYNLTSGDLLRSYPLPGGHVFNDLTISSRGEVFVTDTKEGAVFGLVRDGARLDRIAPGHVFTAVNGVTLSPDGGTLYVASFGDGVSSIDLGSRPYRVRPLPHPASLCLGYIDGLYATKNGLIAIQNGPMIPRIVRFVLSSDGREILRAKVLERGNVDGITTGVMVGDNFYYVANSQPGPLRILKIDVETP